MYRSYPLPMLQLLSGTLSVRRCLSACLSSGVCSPLLPVDGRVPGGGDHQVDGHVHRYHIRHQVLVAEQRPHQALPSAGDHTGRTVKVVHPARQRLLPGTGHCGGREGRQCQVTGRGQGSGLVQA